MGLEHRHPHAGLGAFSNLQFPISRFPISIPITQLPGYPISRFPTTIVSVNLGLAGKVAMIGGASRGLGFAVANALAAEGAHVSVASRNPESIRAAGRRIEQETGADVLTQTADLSSADGIHTWYRATVNRFGKVDLLFTNAGGPPAGRALDFDDAAWQSAFELLVMSAVRQIRLVVPSMQGQGGGAILLSTSSAVKEPIANLALSNVLRASVGALAKTLALELASSRIRVNQIIPGASVPTASARSTPSMQAEPGFGRRAAEAIGGHHSARSIRRAGGVRAHGGVSPLRRGRIHHWGVRSG